MIVSETRPLLSICIPTYNRGNFLRVMLQALLPQVDKHSEDIEVWVLNNASTDETQQVIKDSNSLGPFQTKNQHKNRGSAYNIIDGPVNLAKGEYVWVLGDHNLVRPNAISHVVNTLKQHRQYDVFYVNFRTATFPDHWPEKAVGGYDGKFDILANPDIEVESVEHWWKLLNCRSALCTQNYANILRTSHWKSYWHGREIGEDYTTAETTFPHTVTISKCCLWSPAFAIREAQLTIFNGAQSWGDPTTKLKVCLRGLPQLLTLYRDLGVPTNLVSQFRREFVLRTVDSYFEDAFRRLGRKATLFLFAEIAQKRVEAWKLILKCSPKYFFPNITKFLTSLSQAMKNWRNWYIMNFRPTRWLRTAFSSVTKRTISED